MPALLSPSGNNVRVLLNALAAATAFVCVSAGGPRERRAARAFFMRALMRNSGSLLDELGVPTSGRYVGELVPAAGGWWIGVAIDTARQLAPGLRRNGGEGSLRDRCPLAGVTLGGWSRNRVERRLDHLLRHLNREARWIEPPRPDRGAAIDRLDD